MKTIKCIAVDDEPLSLQKISGYINRVDFLQLEATFSNGFDALNYLKTTHHVDLIFLDIMMEELSGVDLIESLHYKPFFIFTTAYDGYALRAFELQALDYIQKPISFKRFMKAVDKFVKINGQIQDKPQAEYHPAPPARQNREEFIFVRTKYKMQKLNFNDIYYIKGLNNYLIFKTKNTTLYTIQSFNQISKVLPEENFIRVHKSYMVAIDKIDVIGKNQLTIKDDHIPIGESYKEYFFNYLTQRDLLLNQK